MTFAFPSMRHGHDRTVCMQGGDNPIQSAMDDNQGKQPADNGFWKERAQHNRELGQIGERIAMNYLVSNGFLLLDHNWRSKYHYEIDIVAMRKGYLHVIEVKTRTSDTFMDPLAAIGHDKLVALSKAAVLYKRWNRLNCPVVIDGITIVYKDEWHYRLRFYPELHNRLFDDDFVRRHYTRQS